MLLDRSLYPFIITLSFLITLISTFMNDTSHSSSHSTGTQISVLFIFVKLWACCTFSEISGAKCSSLVAVESIEVSFARKTLIGARSRAVPLFLR